MTNLRLSLISICAVAMCVSCNTSTTSLTYFEDLKTSDEGVLDSYDYSIKIIPDDELLITVTSVVPEASSQYNLPLSNPAKRDGLLSQTQPKQQTYIVDKQGNIDFPILGKLHVEGMSTEELKEMLTLKISSDVEDPIVMVTLMNFRVNVLGEVNSPGAITVTRERYTLLDALADAGDMTEYGERSNVTLIREENGKRTYHHMDLNSSEILSSPYFYLQQNDAIYVEPNKIRKDNSKYNQNNSYKISVVSAIVSACSVIVSLIIALAIK